ncbi:hypothetical protein B4V02_00870 [Paenibacillus kribbensis]|uniref:DUF5071 domain-containing protein n=1 Tax=Paenibacillus kribbensis TaxID=172713 RepID=A0A222WG13_9BACL|nr:DUF5071 domain-containing protein [Paenibacillus kribbensis]ASR45360.1 hypothetical protein B4V02_00870 [Paenibacillus kribbensis]
MVRSQDFIPRHKSDFNNINQLKRLEKEQIRPIIAELFTWLKDSNWPISSEIRNILFQFDMDLVPDLKKILKSDDSNWKYFILEDFCRYLPNNVIGEIALELEELSMHPSLDDKMEEVDRIAGEILESLNNG